MHAQKPSTRFLHTSQLAPSSKVYSPAWSAHTIPSDHKPFHPVRLYVSFSITSTPTTNPTHPQYRTFPHPVFLRSSPLYHSVTRHPLTSKFTFLTENLTPLKRRTRHIYHHPTIPPSHHPTTSPFFPSNLSTNNPVSKRNARGNYPPTHFSSSLSHRHR